MSYTRLRYHIVTAVKDRRPLINQEVEDIVHAALCKKAQEKGGYLLQIGGIEDHIHLLAAIPATLAVADFAREVKTASSRAVSRANVVDEPFYWQPGYGAFTVHPFQMQAIWKYVRNQKQRHAEDKLWPRLERWSEENSR